MTTRFEFQKVAPAAFRAMMEVENYVRKSDLDNFLVELVKTRASQINGCAFCIDMHTKDARHAGETEQRLYALSAWQETPFFTPQERAALALTEAVTLIGENGVTDAVYEEVNRHFTPEQIANLLMAIVAINAWNRLSITTQILPGSYQVQAA
ncbi:carboxymuconolactone decarboxylase family protein [Leptolyngbyaceae cyanobacterium CCMR0082]|uniref:Carboxymuconolactone decarboxylase family protein n=1 Tax=Adonisia turfae CCMR0082 TaxID=2304604 RepID=A0A6M0S6P8_9CYAN|nr:carboxymuconolactone decarboxylase family protein [Adonisia turfae]NEZ64137.1 carboxymuconolactone decarboxylase family protein [Adonisia turfae CCMR0082]